ncbi:MAG: sugar ABC transporter permease [Thermoprotei archaeon]|nr:MAG: sugar ABC transporter permease [Thermoprotei archaeon]HDD64142.1 sugar ABC transporter permease [Thermoprotei archaeon]
MGVFIGYPILETIRLAFTHPYTGEISLYNFQRLSRDFHFWNALKYTFLLAGIVIPIQVTLALGVSLLLLRRFKGSNMVLYIFLIPLTISDVAAALIWYNILTGNGYLNRILINLGLLKSPLHFFGYQYRSMEILAIVITEVWRATAIVFVIIFAGLQMIGKEYLEAADVFGASTYQKFRYIILPMIKPSLQTALIIRTLFAMQIFGVVWILAGRDIPILAGETYYWQIELKNPNVAAAYSLIIACISIFLGFLYIKLLKPEYLER